MDCSIIITSKDTKKLLSDCIASIYRSLEGTGITAEIIVVDNGSTDGTVPMIRKSFPKVILIPNKENAGFGKANNQGIAKSKGEYILLLNSDTVVRDRAIEDLVAFAKSHPKSFVGPKLLNPDLSDQTSCGPAFTLPVVFAILFLKGDVLRLTRWSPDRTREVDWVSGACLIAPRAVFLDGLLFDERIFMYMDEIDLLYRAKRKGYTVYFYPVPKVVHIGSASSTNKRKGPILNIYRGFLSFYRTHYPGWKLRVVVGMLQCKALLGIALGALLGKAQVKETYEEALQLVH